MTRMIITPACTDTNYPAPYMDITESYDKIKNLLENYIDDHHFIQCHLAEGYWKGNAVLIRLSSIMQIFDMTPQTHKKEDKGEQND